MSDQPPAPEPTDAITAAASAWLARRDRGLTAAEQDEFLQWLHEDPRRGEALRKLENTWGTLDLLAEWRPAHSAQPNPDLLVPRPSLQRRRSPAAVISLSLGLDAAAALMVGVFLSRPTPTALEQRDAAPGPRGVRVIPPPERLVLADRSTIELNRDGRIETAFSPAERRVRLVRGEAFFSVEKNPARPFVVEVDGVDVRAVGTAFNVRRIAGAVEVLVTEGKVEVERPDPPAGADISARAPMPLLAGERAVVETSAAAAHPVVVAATTGEIERTLAWQGVRLQFEELPLSEVIAEFNLRNSQQLVIGDPALAGLRVGGTFRADRVEAFARLLELSFGVSVERADDGALVLRRAP